MRFEIVPCELDDKCIPPLHDTRRQRCPRCRGKGNIVRIFYGVSWYELIEMVEVTRDILMDKKIYSVGNEHNLTTSIKYAKRNKLIHEEVSYDDDLVARKYEPSFKQYIVTIISEYRKLGINQLLTRRESFKKGSMRGYYG